MWPPEAPGVVADRIRPVIRPGPHQNPSSPSPGRPRAAALFVLFRSLRAAPEGGGGGGQPHIRCPVRGGGGGPSNGGGLQWEPGPELRRFPSSSAFPLSPFLHI